MIYQPRLKNKVRVGGPWVRIAYAHKRWSLKLIIIMSNESQYSANPARSSPMLGLLFPARVSAAEMREPGDSSLLLPEETNCLGRAVPKRIGEFAAGRLCARRALADYSIVDFPLRAAPDRQPLWPAGMVGSITHTAGLCAAVVAERRTLAAVGLDSEIVGHVTPDIWSTVCGPPESDWLRSLPTSEQAAAITLIFSAKEAFYKCQYPVTGEWLDFNDLLIEPLAWGRNPGEVLIRATRRIAFAAQARMPMPGRYRYHEKFVSVGVAMPASTPCRPGTP